MRRILTLAAVAFVFAVAAYGQSGSRQARLSKEEKELIALSRQHVESDTGLLVVADDGLSLTPSGPMKAVEVKGEVAGELVSPAVSIKGDEALVNGRVSFKGRSPEGRAINEESGVRIKYVREKGGWKFVSMCIGACGSV